jgi:hypothetical protein
VLELALLQLSLAQHRQQQQQQQQQQEDGQCHLPVTTWSRCDVPQQSSLADAAARALHRVSRRHLSAARASRTFFNLCRPQQFPWAFLAAAPAVSVFTMGAHDLGPLLEGPQDTLQVLTGRLRALQVQDVGAVQHSSSSSSDGKGGSSSCIQAQMQDLGRLLAGCSGLRTLSLTGCWRSKRGKNDEGNPEWQCGLLEEALLAGFDSSCLVGNSAEGSTANSSSSSSNSSSRGQEAAAATPPTPPLSAAAASGLRGVASQSPSPLRRLDLTFLPFAPFGAWLRRRGQLGQLRRLQLGGTVSLDFDEAGRWLRDLTGLRELRLDAREADGYDTSATALLQALSHLSSSVTQLAVTFMDLESAPTAVIGNLTWLRHLEFVENMDGDEAVQCSWLTALQLLTHLKLNDTPLAPLPPNLGQALPHLEELLVHNCELTDLPRGMTRLSRLAAPYNNQLQGTWMVALSEATGLRQLNLSRCQLSTLSPLSTLLA